MKAMNKDTGCGDASSQRVAVPGLRCRPEIQSPGAIRSSTGNIQRSDSRRSEANGRLESSATAGRDASRQVVGDFWRSSAEYARRTDQYFQPERRRGICELHGGTSLVREARSQYFPTASVGVSITGQHQPSNNSKIAAAASGNTFTSITRCPLMLPGRRICGAAFATRCAPMSPTRKQARPTSRIRA